MADHWHHIDRNGMPLCDGETVFVGINSAGFACCFNQVRPDGLCLMGSPESSTAQMSELRWYRMLDRPDVVPMVAAPQDAALRKEGEE